MALSVAVGDSSECCSVGTLKAVLGEFIGTFLFVFASVSSVQAVEKIAPGDLTVAGLIAVALATGVAYYVTLSITGKISSGHLNPAITFGLVVGGQITCFRAVLLWIAQLLAAAAAAGLLVLIVPQSIPVVGLGASESVIAGLVFELVGTFGLVFVVYALVVDTKDSLAPLAIGLVLAALTFAASPFSGAAFNPARAFGPALLAGDWSNQWVYWVGDFVGAFLASLLYLTVFYCTPTPPPSY